MYKKMKNYVICIVILAMFLLVSCTADFCRSKYNLQYQHAENYDSNWPMFRHDLMHSGFSNSTAPETNTILWSFTPNTDNIWFDQSSPAIFDNKVYIGTCEMRGFVPIFGRIYCLDSFTGEVIWNKLILNDLLSGWIVSSPAVANGKLYFGTLFDGRIHCLDANNGDSIWNYQTSYWVVSSPAVYNGKVYGGSANFSNYNNGEIFCLDVTNGDLIWKYIPDGGVYSSPAIFNNKVYIGSWDGNLYCLNAETGDVIWSYNTGARVYSSPAISNGKVYVGSQNHRVYCIDAENGTEKWNYLTGESVISSPAVAYGKVYIGSHDNSLYCLDALTGSHIWNYSTGSIVFPSPAVADGKVYVGSGSSFGGGGKIHCLNAATGEVLWNLSTYAQVGSSPAVVNGRLYISSQEGSLLCFCDDLPPNKPSKPSGPMSVTVGVIYNYSTSTTDPEVDMVRYGWDWNGDKIVDEWTDFHPSGVTVTISHSWEKAGLYGVRVRAEDTTGLQSEWSNPLPVFAPLVQMQGYVNLHITLNSKCVAS
jgi:outer membrane protein assembly factor BamB